MIILKLCNKEIPCSPNAVRTVEALLKRLNSLMVQLNCLRVYRNTTEDSPAIKVIMSFTELETTNSILVIKD